MIGTRRTYPSDKVTFTIGDLAKDKMIIFLNLHVDMSNPFDVALVMEDSRRNFLNCRNCRYYMRRMIVIGNFLISNISQFKVT